MLVGLIAFSAIVVGPDRIYRRLGYAVDGGLLRVVRGWLFHTDTIVPFVRVQHIDVTRGPLDKLFGTATLVVHTAGTHNSIVTLPGLSPDRAADDPRRHPRPDPHRLRVTDADSRSAPAERLHPLYLVTGLGKAIKGAWGLIAGMAVLGVAGQLVARRAASPLAIVLFSTVVAA